MEKLKANHPFKEWFYSACQLWQTSFYVLVRMP